MAQCVGCIRFKEKLGIRLKEDELSLMCITLWLVDTCWGIVFPSVLCDNEYVNTEVHKSWLADYHGDYTLCAVAPNIFGS
jgi:hypothetical protein